MAITKNDEEVKIQSGNNFKVYYNGGWITLGNVVEHKLGRRADPKEIKYANGYKFKKRASADSSLTVVLAQVTKEIMDTIDNILAQGRALYWYNGLANGYHMEFYVPKANLIESIDLTMSGDEHQTLAIEFSMVPQSTNASVTPTTGMPDDRYSQLNSAQSGTNPFYVILHTAAA